MSTNRSRGFTLIELLVVIAIIGVLSSVVLASLNTARNKGSDAAIKSQLAGVRAQAEIYYDTNGSYGSAGTCTVTSGGTVAAGTGVCTGNIVADTTVANQIKAAAAAAGATLNINVAASGTAWAAAVALKSSSTTYWCVDSAGASKSTTTALSTATVCP